MSPATVLSAPEVTRPSFDPDFKSIRTQCTSMGLIRNEWAICLLTWVSFILPFLYIALIALTVIANEVKQSTCSDGAIFQDLTPYPPISLTTLSD